MDRLFFVIYGVNVILELGLYYNKAQKSTAITDVLMIFMKKIYKYKYKTRKKLTFGTEKQ